ncbi:MAG: CARDB domain-containing protein, partial [Cyanobacteria bacterium J06649_4]
QKVGDEYLITTAVAEDPVYARVAIRDTGEFSVTWEDQDQTTQEYSIYVQRFDSNGTLVGATIEVSRASTVQRNSTVEIDDAGNFLVTWQSMSASGDRDVLARWYNSDGTPQDLAFLVNQENAGDQRNPSVNISDDGAVVFTWNGTDTDGYTNVYSRRFTSETPPAAPKIAGIYLENGIAIAENVELHDRPTAITIDFSTELNEATVTDSANWQLLHNGKDVSELIESITYGVSNDGYNNATANFSESLSSGNYVLKLKDLVGSEGVALDGDRDSEPSGTFTRSFKVSDIVRSDVLTRLDETANINDADTSSNYIASGPNGEYVITWVEGTGIEGIYAQRFDANGNALSGKIKVDESTGTQGLRRPVVSTDANGDFTIVWSGYTSKRIGYRTVRSYHLYSRKFDVLEEQPLDAQGYQPILAGDEFEIAAPHSNSQTRPVIANDDAGNTVVLWSRRESSNQWNIYGQRLDSQGLAIGEEFLVNSATSSYDQLPALAMTSSGEFVATWNQWNSSEYRYDVYAQRFDALGNQVGDHLLVSSDTSSSHIDSQVVIRDDGNFVVTWTSEDRYSGKLSLHARIFGSDGIPLGEPIEISDTLGQQKNSTLAIDSVGNFLITWESTERGASDIMARWYGPEGAPKGDAFIVSGEDADAKEAPAITIDDSGNSVISWIGKEPYSYGGNIFVQRFSVSTAQLSLGDIENQTTEERESFEFTLPVEALGNSSSYPNIQYEVIRSGNRPLPDWLTFDPDTKTLSGIPTDEDAGLLTLVFKATNDSGEIATESFNLTITLKPADLTISNVDAPTQGTPGATLSVEWTVENVGLGTARADWNDAIYLSPKPTFDPVTAILLEQTAIIEETPLASNGSYQIRTDIVIPNESALGDHYLIVVTDQNNAQDESNEINNATPTAITLVASDLQIAAVEIPNTIAIDQPVTVRWTVENGGTGTTFRPWRDVVYISDNPTFDSSAQQIGSAEPPQGKQLLAPEDSYQQSVEVQLQGNVTGQKYLHIVTDAAGQEREITDSNNVFSIAVNVVAPDLEVALSTPASAISGESITVDWRLDNTGSAETSEQFITRFYLSTTAVLDSSRQLVKEVSSGTPLAPGDSATDSFTFELPIDLEGQYYLIAVTDATGTLSEGSADAAAESNNTAVTSFEAILAPYADLSVSDVMAPENYVGDPARIDVRWTVTNILDTGATSTWTDRVWASANETFGDSDDRLLGTYTHNGLLLEGESYTRSETVVLPPRFSGNYRIWVETNAGDEVFENGLSVNNAAAADNRTVITPIPYADLFIKDIETEPTGDSGQTLTVSWEVGNQGIGATNTGSWTDIVYLTNDPTGQSNLTEIGRYNHVGTLAVDQSYERTAQIRLPNGIEGQYYLVVKTGGPYEFTNTANNSETSAAIAVTLTPSPDLFVVSDIVGPSNAQAGDKVDISWQVGNQGDNLAAGSWVDKVTLKTLDGHTVLLGQFQ